MFTVSPLCLATSFKRVQFWENEWTDKTEAMKKLMTAFIFIGFPKSTKEETLFMCFNLCLSFVVAAR